MKRHLIKRLKKIFIACICMALMLSGCAVNPKIKGQVSTPSPTPLTESSSKPAETATPVITPAQPEKIDFSKTKPNEAGKIMVAMFHNFVQTFTPRNGDNGEYTTTFDDFGKLLPRLYDKGYRLISMNDYLTNHIQVPAGCIPMIFTFDDGTAGQFNMIEEKGKLTANKQSAVGILEEFNKTHPDFGLKGTFYVNLGLDTFNGKGTLTQRLQYLIDKGFDIGNHTLTHISLPQAKNGQQIQQEVGGNQKKMLELIPGYQFKSLALPFGQAAKDLQAFVIQGEYQGIKYDNAAIMLVGANPAFSPVSNKFSPLQTARVRATGIKPVQADLDWWLQNISAGEQYVSDGDPNSVTVPKSKEGDISKERLGNKTFIVY